MRAHASIVNGAARDSLSCLSKIIAAVNVSAFDQAIGLVKAAYPVWYAVSACDANVGCFRQ
jgi:hypothetical protein